MFLLLALSTNSHTHTALMIWHHALKLLQQVHLLPQQASYNLTLTCIKHILLILHIKPNSLQLLRYFLQSYSHTFTSFLRNINNNNNWICKMHFPLQAISVSCAWKTTCKNKHVLIFLHHFHTFIYIGQVVSLTNFHPFKTTHFMLLLSLPLAIMVYKL